MRMRSLHPKERRRHDRRHFPVHHLGLLRAGLGLRARLRVAVTLRGDHHVARLPFGRSRFYRNRLLSRLRLAPSGALLGVAVTFNGWLQILALFLVLLAITKPLAITCTAFSKAERPSRRVLAPIERWLLRLCARPQRRTDLDRVRHLAADLQRHWRCSHLRIQRLQHHLPLNRKGWAGGSRPGLQHSGQFHHQHQLAILRRRDDHELSDPDGGLAWHNFVSAGAGLSVALVLARGLTRRPSEGHPVQLGNFTSTSYAQSCTCSCDQYRLQSGADLPGGHPELQRLPAHHRLGRGRADHPHGTHGLAGSDQGTRDQRRGFFNANSAHPFENPNG